MLQGQGEVIQVGQFPETGLLQGLQSGDFQGVGQGLDQGRQTAGQVSCRGLNDTGELAGAFAAQGRGMKHHGRAPALRDQQDNLPKVASGVESAPQVSQFQAGFPGGPGQNPGRTGGPIQVLAADPPDLKLGLGRALTHARGMLKWANLCRQQEISMLTTRQCRVLPRWSVLGFCLAGLLAVAPLIAQAPEPNIATTSWEFHFDYKHMNIIQVLQEPDREPRLYYYLTYKVTNKTGAERLYAPNVWLSTDAGDLLMANQDVPPSVYRAIVDRIKNTLLKPPSQVVGTLLQGEDNALESMAIWPVPTHKLNKISVFFAGLSGETHRMYKVQDPGDTTLVEGTFVPLKQLDEANSRVRAANDRIRGLNPDATEADFRKEAQAEQLPIVLRKTLMLEYDTPGDQTHTIYKPIVFKGSTWVVR